MENINTSVETQVVAEPETDVEESVETQVVAEPDNDGIAPETNPEPTNGRTEQDAAFAAQRRRIEALEREKAELEESNQSMFDALGRFFNGDTAEDLSIEAQAYADERDPAEVRAELESKKLKAENDMLRQGIIGMQAEQLMKHDLQEIQQIDPTVKSLDELGDQFFNFVSAGLSGKEAYYACKARDLKEKVLAPSAIGAVADTTVERDYYTSEELDNLSDAEMEENWDKVMRSVARLGK